MSETPLEFPKPKGLVSVPPEGTGFRLPGTPAPLPQGMLQKRYEGDSAVRVIEIDKLYPSEANSKTKVIAALGLLADAISFLEQARVSAREKNLIEADRYIQRFETLLVPLFDQRKIGDGFALTINSIHFAMINQHGEPLTLEQLTTIWRVLKELRNAPFVSFDQSLSWADEFEHAHLKVDPPAVANFIEDFESE
jgi:hypothetical protein